MAGILSTTVLPSLCCGGGARGVASYNRDVETCWGRSCLYIDPYENGYVYNYVPCYMLLTCMLNLVKMQMSRLK